MKQKERQNLGIELPLKISGSVRLIQIQAKMRPTQIHFLVEISSLAKSTHPAFILVAPVGNLQNLATEELRFPM